MIEATKWGAKAILTDRTDDWLALKHEMLTDWEKVAKETSWKFGFTSFRYTFFHNVSYFSRSVVVYQLVLTNQLTTCSIVPRRFVGSLRPHQDCRTIHRSSSFTQDPPYRVLNRDPCNRLEDDYIRSQDRKPGS